MAEEEGEGNNNGKGDGKVIMMTTTMRRQQATINPLLGNQQQTREVVAVDNITLYYNLRN
jgi:hypothetical protein